MAEQLTVTVQPRTVFGKAVRQLRREGTIPANIFQHGHPSRSVQLEAQELKRLLAAHAGSRIIQLRLNGARETAMVRYIQHEPRSGHVLHVDFMHVEMSEKMRTPVPVRLVGEAPAVRTLGGTLLHLRDTLEVECLPGDLPDALELDISVLDSFDATLYARDVALPGQVTLLDPPEEVVVKVSPPRLVEEEAAAPEAAAPAAPTPPKEVATEE